MVDFAIMLRLVHLRRASVLLASLAVLALGVSVSAVDISGKWVFNVETSAGSGTPTFTFKQDGEKLTGHYVGQLGEADLTGMVKGSDVTFSFTVDVQGNQLQVTYTGTAEATTMKGKVNIAGLGEGTFNGKKQ